MMPQELVLGVGFFNGSVEDACTELEDAGGFLVAPSGPGLASDLTKSSVYREALGSANIVLADSGLLYLWSRYFQKKSIQRISGLLFLKSLLNRQNWVSEKTMWVMPTACEAVASINWLNDCFPESPSKREVYLAPIYPKSGMIEDTELLSQIESSRPKYILIQLGGGTQERLGLYLRQQLSYTPAIICTGAALAFLSGQQAWIPMWADRLFIGWLFRCFHQPKIFVPRYLKAFRLIYLLLVYGEECPSLDSCDC